MTTKKVKKTKKQPADVVFDDDTDSSDVNEEDLKSFRANLAPGSLSHTASDDETDGESESDESGTELTDGDTVGGGEDAAKERGLKRAHVNAKLTALHDLLGKQDGSDKSESESDAKSDVDEEPTPEEDQADVGSNAEASESEESDPEGSDQSGSEENSSHPKKRKVCESKTDVPQVAKRMPKQTNASKGTTDEDQIRAQFREKIRGMSMEELLQMKQDIGTKAMDKMMGIRKRSSGGNELMSSKKSDFKRDNKNRPRETSSKKTVGRFRDVVGLTTDQKTSKRDPRFDSLCGEFDAKIFKDSYKFVDTIKAREVKELKEQLKQDDLDDETKTKIKYLIQRSENQVREKGKLEKRKEVEKEEKKRNRELAKEGKKPQFMSKREKQNVEMVDKYEELKSSGKLENYMKKKSKKNLAKDRKRLKV